MTCKACIHYEACNKVNTKLGLPTTDSLGFEKYCGCFADKSRYIELPCKVGDTVYVTVHPYTFLPLKKVVEGEVVSIHKHEFGLFIRVLFDTKKINGCADYEKWTWGERLFFTNEDAERALKEAQDDKR